MCAADPGQDSCQGDSGGPLYDSSSGKLVGLVSFGDGKLLLFSCSLVAALPIGLNMPCKTECRMCVSKLSRRICSTWNSGEWQVV